MIERQESTVLAIATLKMPNERRGSTYGNDRPRCFDLHRVVLGIRVHTADDVLGELDAGRKAAFWKSLHDEYQIFATGTEQGPLPTEREWALIYVKDGVFQVK